MSMEVRQTESLTNLLEAISRWEALAANLRSQELKDMVAEHTEFLKQQLNRHMAKLSCTDLLKLSSGKSQ